MLPERLRKKDAPGRLYKSSTENMPFFNRNKFVLFINAPSLKMEHIYIGWKKTAKKLKGDF